MELLEYSTHNLTDHLPFFGKITSNKSDNSGPSGLSSVSSPLDEEWTLSLDLVTIDDFSPHLTSGQMGSYHNSIQTLSLVFSL